MTPDEVNALPDRVRQYIHDLETNCDPSGIVRDNFRLREENAMLRKECERLFRDSRLIPLLGTAFCAGGFLASLFCHFI